MTLKLRLQEYISACFTGLWLETHESEDALTEIAGLCQEQNWQLTTWDIHQGFASSDEQEQRDPLTAINFFAQHASPQETNLLVLRNFHRFLGSPEVIQALTHQLHQGKQHRNFILILAPKVDLPVELEKQFLVLQHDLPDRQQLQEIASGVATEEGDLPEGVDLEQVLDAASGLTRHEAESAFALSLVREGRLTPTALWELKTGLLKQSGLLELHRGNEVFDDLGGLTALKTFCRRALRPGNQSLQTRPRGLMLLGVPGTGKSQFAKALGNETGRPTLALDIGRLMGSLVGQTESNIRQALQIADAMAPCILFIDEVEKGLSGVGSSGANDSGVSARMFSTFLTWLNDHTTDVFVIATCNDISKLPPEFSRSERFDGIFFLDLPGAEQKTVIWNQYLQQYGLDRQQPKPLDESWTGAEIKSACRLSDLLDVPLLQAAQNVVPVAHTAKESVVRLQNWASGRCLSADRPGIYHRPHSKDKPRRQVQSQPTLN